MIPRKHKTAYSFEGKQINCTWTQWLGYVFNVKYK